MDSGIIAQNYNRVMDEIRRAALACNRAPEEVRLMAVTKTQPVEAVQALYDLGHRLFGENRVKEGLGKIQSLPKDAQVELIGQLQSNKVRDAVGAFSGIQSVDRTKILELISQFAEARNVPQTILLEVNTSGEESKSGLETWEELLELALKASRLPYIQFQGLMTMAPFTQEKAPIRQSFRLLRQYRERLEESLGPLPILSMGMSNDYTLAIEEGSTLVRVGTALFRAPNPQEGSNFG